MYLTNKKSTKQGPLCLNEYMSITLHKQWTALKKIMKLWTNTSAEGNTLTCLKRVEIWDVCPLKLLVG